jgi:hypothetical protein
MAERGKLQFPIVGDVPQFIELKRRGRISGVPGKQRTEIHRLQPYHRGWPNVWLKVLSDLDNTDKHRFVHVVASTVQWAGIANIPDGHTAIPEFARPPYFAKPDTQIVRITLDPPKANVDVDFLPEWVLAIEAGQIPGGAVDTAFHTLENVVSVVEEVLKYLEFGRPESLLP